MVYRDRGGPAGTEVFLVHPGGPYWVHKEAGAWSIPKGECGPDEDALATALREFVEEIGQPAPHGAVLDLGEVTQRGGKRVRAFAVRGDVDPTALVSNTFTTEWPPGSGEHCEFPEVDRGEWFSLAAAEAKINHAQTEFLTRLGDALGG